MNKSKAIRKFVVICVLVVIGLLACFNYNSISLRVPFTDQKFKGFMGAIEDKMGIDLKGGVLAVFDTEGDPSSSQIQATVDRLERMLYDRGHFDTTVVRQGSQIRIEMPGTDDTQSIFDAIGTPAELSMNLPDGDPVVFTSDDIKSVEYSQQSLTEHGTVLNFTTAGGEKFYALLESAGQGGTIEIWAGDRNVSSNKVSSPTVNEVSVEMKKSTIISGSSKESAQALKLRIESGLFEVKLKPAETSVIPATLGADALLAGIIACILGLVFVFIIMYLLYGDLGLLSNLSLLVFTISFLFALAVIGSIQLTLPGIAGIILSIGMAVDANILIFERIKDEYKNGKRMAVAVESGFNKTVKTIIDANVTTVIASAVLYFLGTGPIQGFAITLFLGVAISMFCSLVVTRSFAKTYLYINNSNEKRLKLKKSETVEDGGSSNAKSVKPTKRALNFGSASKSNNQPSEHMGLVRGEK